MDDNFTEIGEMNDVELISLQFVEQNNSQMPVHDFLPASLPNPGVVCGKSCTNETEDFDTVDLIQYSTEAAAIGSVLFVGILFNSLVLLLFYLKPTLRTFSNIFVLSLTFSHLLQSVLIMPTVFITSIHRQWIFGDTWCQITGCLTICLNVASVLSVLLIAVDRHCAVNNPLHYSTTITKKKTVLLISGTWVLSCIAALPPVFGLSKIDFRRDWHSCTILWDSSDFWNLAYASVLALMGFFIPLSNVGWIYFTMFKAARDNSARTKRNSVTSTHSDVLISIEPNKLAKMPELKTLQLRKYTLNATSTDKNTTGCFGGEFKAVKTGLFVVLSFMICWLPFFLSILSEPYLIIPQWMCFLITLSAFLSCVVNPYLYVFRNKTSRKLVKKLLECRWKTKKFEPSKTLGRCNLTRNKRVCVANVVRDTSHSVPPRCVLQSSNINSTLTTSYSEAFINDGQKDYSELDHSLTNLVAHCVDKGQIFSINSPNPFVHQDSTTSSESSDMGISSVLIDSSTNVNTDFSNWCGQFPQQRNENIRPTNSAGNMKNKL